MSHTKKSSAEPQYKRFKYSDESMSNAILAVKRGESLNNAAAAYNVPKSTLHSRVTGKMPEKGKMGPKSILTADEEEELKRWILSKAQAGFPMHPDEIKDSVQKVLLDSPRDNPFKANRPGNKWLSLFMRRHPEISAKNMEIISKAKITVTQEGLKDWFSETRNFLDKKKSLYILHQPYSIFYTQESGIQVCPKSGVVLGPKDGRRSSELPGTDKEFITVLLTFSAAGDIVPPMVIYPYKRIPTHIQVLFPDEWSIGKSETGMMTNVTFQDYITKCFHPWCLKQKLQFPVIIFTDSQKYQVTAELHEFCVKHRIIIYSLPLNSTGMMKKFDIAVLKPLRDIWKQVINEGKQPGAKAITKSTFAPLCKRSFDECLVDDREKLIKKGFRIVGLFPFDENVVDYSKCQSGSTSEEFPEKFIMMKDFKSARKVIEHFIGPQQTELFENIRREGGRNAKTSVDSLFLCWKVCVDNVEGKMGKIPEGTAPSREKEENDNPAEFIETFLSFSIEQCMDKVE